MKTLKRKGFKKKISITMEEINQTREKKEKKKKIN